MFWALVGLVRVRGCGCPQKDRSMRMCVCVLLFNPGGFLSPGMSKIFTYSPQSLDVLLESTDSGSMKTRQRGGKEEEPELNMRQTS